jgi:perosamine synthetase
MNDFIPVNEPLIGDREKELVLECLETGWISSEGPFVSQFEEVFSKRSGRKYGVACCNGTAALDLAVAALHIGPGDEVILPTFTIISCAAAVIRAGATPVFVDCDPITFNMDISQVADAVTSRTVAIMVVHIYGLPVDMDPILEIANRFKLAIIEDAAELIGGQYKDHPIGSFGNISTFSFYPNKHVTTGEGGMVVTDDPELAERARSFRNLCFQPQKRFQHEELGWNYRMTNIQAALGIAQLESLEQTLILKRSIGSEYNSLLDEHKHLFSRIQLPVASTSYAENLYWVYPLITDIPAAEMCVQLAKKGIGTRPFFYPMHLQPCLAEISAFSPKSMPVSEHISEFGFYLPSGLTLTKQKQARVISALIEILSSYSL